MTTYTELQDKVARALQDPDNATFDTQAVKDMIASSYADLGRIAPQRFVEDIVTVDDTLSYQVRSVTFPEPNDDIELMSVEVWDGSTTPDQPYRLIDPQSSHPTGLSYSQAGWRFWGGVLYLPNRVVDFIDPTKHYIKVWGYAPWAELVNGSDVVPFGRVHQEALVIRCHIEAMRRLIGNRILFSQWQTRSNNTDITPGMLMNEKTQAESEWRVLARAIQVLREAP